MFCKCEKHAPGGETSNVNSTFATTKNKNFRKQETPQATIFTLFETRLGRRSAHVIYFFIYTSQREVGDNARTKCHGVIVQQASVNQDTNGQRNVSR